MATPKGVQQLSWLLRYRYVVPTGQSSASTSKLTEFRHNNPSGVKFQHREKTRSVAELFALKL
jgi:hypothetical protein